MWTVIQLEKCQILKSKVYYLGHVIENGRITPSNEKTNAVKHFMKPTNVRSVQSFLGLIGYFRKFIPQYSLIARPLMNLLQNGTGFKFGKEQERALIGS